MSTSATATATGTATATATGTATGTATATADSIAKTAEKINATVFQQIDDYTSKGMKFHDAFFKAMTEAGDCGHGIAFFRCMSCSH
jgi:hypothetical protein